MSSVIPPEVPVVDEEFHPFQEHSRRFTVVAALLLAGGIVAAAWVGGDRQGLDQIVWGGVDASLLPKVGDPAPDFTTTIVDQQGRPVARVHLSDFRGQPVWLNFWGSWCPPCRAEMPEIQAAYEQLEPQGFVWLAVSLDEPAEDAAGFAALNGATFLIASDPNRVDTGAAYPIAYFPTHLLIDRDGIVRDVLIAAVDQEQIIARARQLELTGQ